MPKNSNGGKWYGEYISGAVVLASTVITALPCSFLQARDIILFTKILPAWYRFIIYSIYKFCSLRYNF